MMVKAANLQQPPQKVSPTRRDSQSLPPPVESLESLCWAFGWFEGEYLWLKKKICDILAETQIFVDRSADVEGVNEDIFSCPQTAQ